MIGSNEVHNQQCALVPGCEWFNLVNLLFPCIWYNANLNNHFMLISLYIIAFIYVRTNTLNIYILQSRAKTNSAKNNKKSVRIYFIFCYKNTVKKKHVSENVIRQMIKKIAIGTFLIIWQMQSKTCKTGV